MNVLGIAALKKVFFAVLPLALLLSSAAVAADDDVATLAFLRFGQSPAFALTDKAVLDTLEAYGYISNEERMVLQQGGDLRGEHINILYRDAGFDLATANLMVEDALDEGADVMLTVSTEVGMIAAGAMTGMDDPPALIFAIVTAPYLAGIAEAPCVKPPNITGTQMDIDFLKFDAVREAQNPGLTNFGMIVNPNDPASQNALQTLGVYAQARGLTFEAATAITVADYSLATESLLDKGVEAIVMPPRTGSAAGLLAVLDAAYGATVYSTIVTDVFIGVPVGAGFQGWYHEGAVAGRMLVGYLRGELDIARTGINLTPGFTVAANLDAADVHGIEIRQELLDQAAFVIEGGAGAGAELEIPGVNTFLEEMTAEERWAQDQAFLEGLHCSDEMIAEQMAALEAGGE